jgi:hypothetical protein
MDSGPSMPAGDKTMTTTERTVVIRLPCQFARPMLMWVVNGYYADHGGKR